MLYTARFSGRSAQQNCTPYPDEGNDFTVIAFYQSSFSPNCTWRELVDVLVMAPAVPDRPLGLVVVGGVKTIRFGVLKFVWFSKLKISLRNCRFRCSWILVSFNTEKSQVVSPGPTYVSLPTLP